MNDHNDEPVDLQGILADDALIGAIAEGDRPHDPLGDVLSALAASGLQTHLLPMGRSVVTWCCGRRLDELPSIDHVTDDPDAVTCTARKS